MDLGLLCSCLFDSITYSMWGILLLLVFSHIISRIHLFTKPHLKLNKQSFVVITGACTGIGKQMASSIAKLYHCKILIADIRKDLFEQLNSTLSQLGSSTQCIYCDLSDDKSVEEFISLLNKRNQKIDLFIHNAGVHIPKKALQTSEKQFLLQFKINFLSPVKIINKTIHLMENGHIAVIASIVALVHGGVDISTYASTKYALYSFVNSLRQELAVQSRNVTISMGCPYLIKTGMFDGFRTKLDFIMKQLEPQYVGQRLVREFIQKKDICYVYEYEALLFKLMNLFPTQILDLFSTKLNISNFDKIRDRHDEKIKKTQ